MNDIESASLAAISLESDPRWLLAQRIVQSELFRHSPRLRGFLLFVVDRTLRNRTAELGEYEIGTQVFDRTVDFNPADDSIVRSSARLLRAKLKEYFAGEGREEPLLIEVPKGGYVPAFVPRAQAGAAGLDGILTPKAARTPVPIYVLSFACVVLLVACCALLWRSRALLTVPSGRVSPPNLIFSIFPPGAQINLVYCDSARVIEDSLRPSNLTLDEYIRGKERKPVAVSRLITSYRDAAFGMRLAEAASREGRILISHHSRLMQARDFRAGNFLMLGGALSNPWVALFEPQLNFRFEMDSSGHRRYGFRNVAPRTGEARFYWSSSKLSGTAVWYARIALIPNLTGTGRVLMLAGELAEGTEGAEDAALARDFPAQVQAVLGNRPLHEITNLELLLEVHSVDGAAHDTKILAYRVR